MLICVQLFGTPWTIQSMEFSRPEYWNGQPFPSPGDLPNPGTKPRSPTLQADSLPAEPQGKLKNTGVGSLSFIQRNLSDPRIQPRSPALQADSLPTELSGKPQSVNTFKPLVQEASTCCKATKPARHNYRAHTRKLACCNC